MIRPELKSIALMNDLVSSFSKPRQLVLDLNTWSLWTVKVYLAFEKHCCFIWMWEIHSSLGEVDVKPLKSACLSGCEPGIIFEWKWTADGGNTSIIGARKGRRLRCALDKYVAPSGLQSIQRLQDHVVSWLCSLHSYYSVCNIGRYVPCTIWFEVKMDIVEHLYQWHALPVVWYDESGCHKVQNIASDACCGLFCKFKAWEKIYRLVSQWNVIVPEFVWQGPGR